MARLSLVNDRGTPRLLVKCDYNERHLVKLASFGVARWRPKEKAYSLPTEPVVIRRLTEFMKDLRVDPGVLDWADRLRQHQEVVMSSVKDTSPLTEKPLVPFQMASVRFLASARRAILGHDMGTGKTPISCVALDYVNASKVLIVCPNTVKWSWVDHLNEWSSQRNIFVLESASSSGAGATVLSGNKDRRDDLLAETLTLNEECVIIMNYSQLRIHSKLLCSFDFDVLIADEAHRVGNRKAQQTEAFLNVAKVSVYVWMLTGTPVRNRYTDLYTLLSACDPVRFSSYWNFVNIHLASVPNYYGGVDIVGLRDPEGFNSMLSTYMYRVEKKEAMPELPDKLYHDYRLVMLPEQHRLYQQMEEEFLISIEKQLENGEKLETILRAPNVAAQIIRLRQLCLTPEILGGPPSSAKLEALKDTLQDIEGSFIIFSCFRKFLSYVSDVLEELKIPFGLIVGGQSSWERAEVVSALNSGKIRAVLGTIQSMGEGLNLQAARTAIFCDTDWVPAVNDQAEARIHRGAITERPVIIRLFHPGTVEADIRMACRRKERIAGETTGQVEAVREMLIRRGREALGSY